jgi:hypothetical protein
LSATIIQIAPVRKTVRVKASPQRAFEVFTAGIDRWWPKTHGIGTAALRESVIELGKTHERIHRLQVAAMACAS